MIRAVGDCPEMSEVDAHAPAVADRAASSTISTRRLGTTPYEPVRDAMIGFTGARHPETRDEIWLVEHPPVYTLGQAGRMDHVLRDVGIPVVRTERGGQVTYHGPGQAIAYLMIDLKRRGIKVREFVRLIESALIALLAAYNLKARTRAGAPGVYVEVDGNEHKVAALGLKIVNGRSFHGASLNVAMDLGPYDHIDACGYPGLRSIDLASLGVNASPAAVADQLAEQLIRHIELATR